MQENVYKLSDLQDPYDIPVSFSNPPEDNDDTTYDVPVRVISISTDLIADGGYAEIEKKGDELPDEKVTKEVNILRILFHFD